VGIDSDRIRKFDSSYQIAMTIGEDHGAAVRTVHMQPKRVTLTYVVERQHVVDGT
jgi:hypothetical protein